MSLILDALKRAERERQGEPPAAPREVPASLAGVQPTRRSRDIAGAIIIVVGLALAAALLWDAFRSKPTQTAAPTEVREPAASPPVIVARPAPPEPAPAVVPGTEAVASLDDLSDEPTLEGTPASPSKPVPLVPAAKDPGPDVIATRPAPAPKVARPAEIPPPVAQTAPPKQSPPAVTQPAPQPEPAPPQPAAQPQPAPSQPAAQSQPAPPAEIPPALTQPAPLRKFREMPPDYRADFPALKIEIHVYEKAQQRRFVMINGRKYREGERLAEGPSLVEIVPDGIVLEYRGEKVLYTLGR